MSSLNKCNYDSTIGEFYSGKQKIYSNTITSNNINSKIFTIISGISILFTIVFFVISFVIYKNNQSTNNNNNNNNNNSAFSTGPKILLVLGIISFIVLIISIFFIYKYKIQETPKPLIDDEQRPCYSDKLGKKLDPIPSLNTVAAPPPPVLLPSNSSPDSNSVTMNLIKGITGNMTTLNKSANILDNSTSKPPSDNLNTIISNNINNNANSLTNNNQSMSVNAESNDKNDTMFNPNQSLSNTDSLNSNNIINNNVNL